MEKPCIQIRTLHPFNFSTLSFLLVLHSKRSSIESSLTTWSNLLDVKIRIILLQHNTTAPVEVASSGLVRSASNSGQRATRRIQWHPQILLRRTSQDLSRDSSENLPTKSVSDTSNILVVQLSMTHLKVWRWLECLYYRLAIEYRGMWITNRAKRGTPNQALVSDEFIQTCIQDVTQEM